MHWMENRSRLLLSPHRRAYERESVAIKANAAFLANEVFPDKGNDQQSTLSSVQSTILEMNFES
jgi:hypothetical protein